MNLRDHYKDLYQTSIKKIEKGDYHIDSLIDSSKDRRLGISLVIRPPEAIKTKIQVFLNGLKQIDPAQYYYPNSDIHITVMAIISCYQGFEFNEILVSDYRKLVNKSLEGIEKFNIKLEGITASGSGLMIRGFPEDKTIDNLRNNLRIEFKNSALEQSIDKRYFIKTTHSTVVRFRSKLQNRPEFLDLIEKNIKADFGSFEIDELELVLTDWYHRKSKVVTLEKFEL